MVHAKVLASLQKELANKYDLSSTIRHKGERGRQREAGVSGFLRENLPSAYGVATGELFSFSGDDVSPQCDVIVYDALRTPILGRSAEVQQIPIEGTYAVVEIKSILDTGALDDVVRKFTAIRSMWRHAYPDLSIESGPAFFLFGYRMKTTVVSCTAVLRANTDQDISIVALDGGCSVWVGNSNDPASRPEWLDMPAPEFGMYSALAFFLFGILEACRAELMPLDFGRIFLRG
jgi:hypothetical protein